MTELPAMERLRLRIIRGTLAMLSRQVAELSPQTRAHVFGESTRFVTAWHDLAAEMHASTVDAA